MIKRYILILLLIFSATSLSWGQELNARLTVNASKIQSVDRDAIKEIEEGVRSMLNEQTWTNAQFGKNEKIDCTVTITLNTMPAENSYGGEIHITSRRPVYNSSYETVLINYRDTKFDFNYIRGQTLDYNGISLDNNLVGVIVFYINILIGLDFDSFSLNGGQPYFAKALEVANLAQTLGTKGWEPFDGKSRYDLAMALTEESSKGFHTLWYNYHRLGLDEMSGNASRGRIRIIETLKELEALKQARPNSLLLTLFMETKLDEFIKVCSEARTEEKKDLKSRLKKLFPSKSNLIDNIK